MLHRALTRNSEFVTLLTDLCLGGIAFATPVTIGRIIDLHNPPGLS